MFDLGTVGRSVFWFLCLLMAAVALRFIFLDMSGLDGTEHMAFQRAQRMLALYAHAIISMAPIVLLPFQFWRGLRNSRRNVHRWSGRVYVVTVIIGGLAGIFLGLNADMRPLGAAGFVFGATIWIATTVAAAYYAIVRDVFRHRQWVMLSGAMTFAAVGIRFEFPLFRHVFNFDYQLAYEMSAWSCWVINLLVLYLWHLLRASPGTLPGFRTLRSDHA